MDRRSFLVINFGGLLAITVLHLAELWSQDGDGAFHRFLSEWLPLYLVWICMLLIGLLQRAASCSKKPPDTGDV